MMNMFRGKPALKFKELKDIYETGEAGNHHLLPVTRPKLELDEWSIDSDRAKTESPRVLAGATIKTESESPQSNCSSDGDGGKTESDDVDFGTMTLKQFKERYKTKKGKLSRNAGLIGQTSETCSPAKQEPSDSQFELEELTAMEPLSTWRSRIFKSRKKKRKSRLESSYSSSSESVPCIVKSKRKKSDQVVFQTSEILPAPIDIKVEVMEPISFDCRYATLINSSLCCGEPLASSLVVSSGEPEIADGCVLETGMLIASVEEPEIADGCVLETGMLIASVEEPETANDDGPQMSMFSSDEPQCYVANDQSYEEKSHVNPESILDVDASCGEILTADIAEAIGFLSSDLSLSEIKEEDSVVDSHPIVDPAGVVSPIKGDSSIAYNDSQSEEPERVEDHGFETHKLAFFGNELQCYVVNEESYEPVEHADPKSMPDVRASGGEMRMVDVGELTTAHNSCLSSTELKKESFAAYPYPQNCGDDSIEVASPSKHHASDMGNESQDFPGMHELLESKSDSQVQVPDISMVNTSQSTELSDRHGLHVSEDEAKDDIPLVEASVISSPVSGFISSRDSILCSGQDGCLASAAAEEKKAPLSACGDAARKFSAIDEPVTLTNVQGCHHSKLQQLPEKLLSTRKVRQPRHVYPFIFLLYFFEVDKAILTSQAISPTSQKKLCKAMEASDLDDEEYYSKRTRRHV